MSQASGVRGFTVNFYGQSGLAMDWFGLTDPFGQQMPAKITNTYSGTLWFQGGLVNPPSGYYNYSGIQLGAVNSGASATLVQTWDRGVSGWIATSSPITDTLTWNIQAFTSSNYTGLYSSGTFTLFNTLFNRYSGMIKIFGDIYSNDQPTPSVAQGGTGTLSGAQSYAVSYLLSGWESDIGAATSLTTNSGGLSVSWTSITGVTQYFVYRWSGTADLTLHSGVSPPGGGQMRIMDLVYASNQTSITDTGSAIQSGLYRHRTWQRYQGSGTADANTATTDANTYLSAPQSRTPAMIASCRNAHTYQLAKNLSGTNLLGPFYGVLHARFATTQFGLMLQTGNDGAASGTTIADNTALSGQLVNVWYRHTIQLGASGSISASGLATVQFYQTANNTLYVDDVFIVATS